MLKATTKKGLVKETGLCGCCAAACPEARRCTRCMVVCYCDSHCQRKHWKMHRPQCKKSSTIKKSSTSKKSTTAHPVESSTEPEKEPTARQRCRHLQPFPAPMAPRATAEATGISDHALLQVSCILAPDPRSLDQPNVALGCEGAGADNGSAVEDGQTRSASSGQVWA